MKIFDKEKSKKGITVLICTYNGEKNLPETLSYLAKQKVEPHIEWEILLVDNASRDNSSKTALEAWNAFGGRVPFKVYTEKKRGKDNAIDLGFKKAKYSFVIICDDDNWLNENYVQLSYNIMRANPEIGMLGGQGIPAFERGCVVPNWFSRFQRYYAVGAQNFLNGEVDHYWPTYRFIWGAGAVINLEAYRFLEICEFKKILTFNRFPAVARSEDVELSLAIWLAGFKLWYDDRLTFQHFISKGKLDFSYFISVVKQSISSIHYLHPYQVLIFTGVEDAPEKSFWKKYIILHVSKVVRHFRRWKHFKILIRIIFNKHLEDEMYVQKAVVWYRFRSVIGLGRRYDRLFKRVSQLQKSLSAYTINKSNQL